MINKKTISVITTVMTLSTISQNYKIVSYIKKKINAYLNVRNFDKTEVPEVNLVISRTNDIYNELADEIGSMKIAPSNVIYYLLINNRDILEDLGIKYNKIENSPLTELTEDASVNINTHKFITILERKLQDSFGHDIKISNTKTLPLGNIIPIGHGNLDEIEEVLLLRNLVTIAKRNGTMRSSRTDDGRLVLSDNDRFGVFTPISNDYEFELTQTFKCEGKKISNHIVHDGRVIYICEYPDKNNKSYIVTISLRTGDTVVDELHVMSYIEKHCRYVSFDLKRLADCIMITPVNAKDLTPFHKSQCRNFYTHQGVTHSLVDTVYEYGQGSIEYDYRFSYCELHDGVVVCILKDRVKNKHHKFIMGSDRKKTGFGKSVLNDYTFTLPYEDRKVMCKLISPYIIDDIDHERIIEHCLNK